MHSMPAYVSCESAHECCIMDAFHIARAAELVVPALEPHPTGHAFGP
jgi:hypothetical protein